MANGKTKLLVLICLSVAPLVRSDACKPRGLPQTPKASVSWLGGVARNDPTRKVTSVKTEASPSHSYAYCATALVEARYAEKGTPGAVISFSTQQILDGIDKSKKIPKTVKSALEYVQRIGGLKCDMAYKEYKGCGSTILQRVENFCSAPFSEFEIKRRVSLAPVCVELTVPQSFLSHGKEVYECKDIPRGEQPIKYSALLYGYDTDYYYIKTSRGLKWGKGGLAKLKNGSKCGLSDQVAYAVVEAEKWD